MCPCMLFTGMEITSFEVVDYFLIDYFQRPTMVGSEGPKFFLKFNASRLLET